MAAELVRSGCGILPQIGLEAQADDRRIEIASVVTSAATKAGRKIRTICGWKPQPLCCHGCRIGSPWARHPMPLQTAGETPFPRLVPDGCPQLKT
ncbi:MAG: hypothetical protein Q7S40_11550 [Opitutaceae bacterium]|nr:hypothetical protein [Opitutaceae bacterium]